MAEPNRRGATKREATAFEGRPDASEAPEPPVVQAEAPFAQRRREEVRVLFIAANEDETRPLWLDREYKAIEQELRSAPSRGVIKCFSAWAASFADLRRCLLEHDPDIVHFAGHGSSSSDLLLLDDKGEPAPIPPAALRELFEAVGRSVSLVVLNACFSREQASAVLDTVGLAVGMSEAIEDEAAIAFSSGFYGALAYGRSVREAHKVGRSAVAATKAAHGAPLLLIRPGSDAGRTFFTPSGAPAKRPWKARLIAHFRRRRRGIVIVLAAFGLTATAAGALWQLRTRMSAPEIVADPTDHVGTCVRLLKSQSSVVAPTLAGSAVSRDEATKHHAQQLRTFNGWADVYRKSKDYGRAGPLYECVLELRKKTTGADRLEAAKTLRGLAMTYKEQREFGRAKPLLDEALAIFESEYGVEAPALVEVLNDAADVSTELGDLEHSRTLLVRASKILGKYPGPGAVDTARSLDDLAQRYRAKGDSASADALVEQARLLRDASPDRNISDLSETLASPNDPFPFSPMPPDHYGAGFKKTSIALRDDVEKKCWAPDVSHHTISAPIVIAAYVITGIDGFVEHVSVAGGKSSQFVKCIVQEIERQRFPERDGGGEFAFTFSLFNTTGLDRYTLVGISPGIEWGTFMREGPVQLIIKAVNKPRATRFSRESLMIQTSVTISGTASLNNERYRELSSGSFHLRLEQASNDVYKKCWLPTLVKDHDVAQPREAIATTESVGPTGFVTRASLGSSAGGTMDDCVMEIVMSLKFEPYVYASGPTLSFAYSPM